MNYIEQYNQYIKSNPDKVCNKVKTIYERLSKEMNQEIKFSVIDSDGNKQEKVFVFDEKKGERAIEFIERFCKHSKGKWGGKPIKLELFQKAFLQATYGFVEKTTRLRRYKKIMLYVARKNGKSTLASGISLFQLYKDGEHGAEVVSCAVKREQAKIVHDEAVKMINKSPALRSRTRCLTTGVFYDEMESKMSALASESKSLDGLNCSCAICDEVHEWRDFNLLKVIEDSMIAREQPILCEVSTMGTTRESVFDNEYDYASKVIDGTIEDYSLLPIIYELDSREEWQNEVAWEKANPALNSIKDKEALRQKVERAKANPNELTNLLCKDFNIRMVADDHWLSFEDVDNDLTFTEEELKDTYAVGGADLSSTTDLTCATLLVVRKGIKYVLQQYFIPKAKLEQKIKEDKIPYDIWADRGFLTLCEGAKVNYTDVTNWFLKMVNDYGIRPLWVGYDAWNSQYWLEEMQGVGFEMEVVIQGARTLSSPMKTLKADLIDNKVNYNQNPILKWCLCNTSIQQDANENIRPVKTTNQRARIDGAVSLCIAYTEYLRHENDLLSMEV